MTTAIRWAFLTFLPLLAGQHGALAAQASLAPPQYVGPPRPEHAVTNRAFQGIPSMAVAPGGRFWANWYAGVTPGEDHNNYVVLSTSGNRGMTWKEVLIIDPDGGGTVRAFDPELWVSPDGRLFAFWAQMDRGRNDTQLGVWCMETHQADAEQPEWSRPRRIADGVMMCKPLTLSTGEWVLPVSKWRQHDNSAQMIVSIDQGESWTLRGGCNVPVEARSFDEHMLIERRDGSIWLLARTNYGIGESVSTDRGKTWPALQPSTILHPSARFFIRRLATDNLLLVKHGSLDRKTNRSHLTAFLSTDDGRTWSGGLMLDERDGVSYPDGQQTPDGIVHIIYDFQRVRDRNILMARFCEEDVAAGKEVSDAVRLCQLVSKASGGQEIPRAPSKPMNANASGEPMRKKTPGTLTLAGAESPALAAGVKLFTDRNYLAAEMPKALQAAHFLRIAMDGAKSVTCQRAGTVWFLTPAPGRNRDSQSQALMDQGFQMVALQEVPVFHPTSAANYCTLYQKDCSTGEMIFVDKWAVPVFLP